MKERDNNIFEIESKRYKQTGQLVGELRDNQRTVLQKDDLARTIVNRYNDAKDPKDIISLDKDTSFFVTLREPFQNEISKFFDQNNALVVSLAIEQTKPAIQKGATPEKQTRYIDLGDLLEIGRSFETALPYPKVVKAKEFAPIVSLAKDLFTLAEARPEVNMRTVTVNPLNQNSKAI